MDHLLMEQLALLQKNFLAQEARGKLSAELLSQLRSWHQEFSLDKDDCILESKHDGLTCQFKNVEQSYYLI